MDMDSEAVMPFKNMTGDSTYHLWQEGLQNLLITSLSNCQKTGSQYVYCRKVLILYPDDSSLMAQVAHFLISYDKAFDEGLALLNSALEKDPENCDYLHT